MFGRPSVCFNDYTITSQPTFGQELNDVHDVI